MIIDTDILIWYMRGNQKAGEALSKLDNFSISDVVYMEILQGIRNKTELQLFKQYILFTH
jgi:predicted nucleic acid-binding protein